jgi:hypothetical protein
VEENWGREVKGEGDNDQKYFKFMYENRITKHIKV